MTVLDGERNNEDHPQLAEVVSQRGGREVPDTAFPEAAADQQSNIHHDSMPTTNISNTTGERQEQQQQEQEEAVQEGDEDDSEMVRKWKASPFAIGLTNATWADDDLGCVKTCWSCCNGSKRTHVYCTACICRHFGCVGRVGNMIVLRQTMEDVAVDVNAEDGNVTRRTIRRPRLRCVVGPYWMITFFVVVPFFTVLSLWVARRLFTSSDDDQEQPHLAVVLVWIFFTAGLFFSLFQVACSDPGIQYRYANRPDSIEGGDEWIWNDQALSYRPQHAKFDPDVQCIVKHFDHACPWTSTAIGGGNILWFYMFLFFVFGTIFYDIILLTFLGSLQ
jgi:DHHC palmitoyltransferase